VLPLCSSEASISPDNAAMIDKVRISFSFSLRSEAHICRLFQSFLRDEEASSNNAAQERQDGDGEEQAADESSALVRTSTFQAHTTSRYDII
jgi:hypothetical protein